jgi:lipopolysaccharide/colanic/teichoic acid biosynthesis glycosyltransferase
MGQGPQQAFPYTPPSAGVRAKYVDVFSLRAPPNERWIKFAFDKIFVLIALVAASPILCLIFASHYTLALFIPDQRGRLVISYRAVSQGKVFPKYKFRVIREAFIDKAESQAGNWEAYAAEWDATSHTYLGVVIKKLYFDELPQLFNILLGHMSVVGPRPLAERHYERDLAQGNIYRKLVKAGLFGPSQALKGTCRYGDPEVECEYVDRLLKLSGPVLLWYDFKLIAGGLRVVAQATGL